MSLISIILYGGMAVHATTVDVVKEGERAVCEGRAPSPLLFEGREAGDSSYEASVFRLFWVGNADSKFESLANSNEKIETSSHSNRLDRAYALTMVRSTDLDLLGRLVDFESEDDSIKSHQAYLKSVLLSLEGKHEESLHELVKSVSIAPIIRSSQVLSILEANQEDGRSIAILNDNADRIQNRRLRDGVKNRMPEEELVAQAYKECPLDQALAEAFAGELIHNQDFARALKILESIVNETKYPSALSEYLVAIAYDHLGQSEKALSYYRKAASPENLYLPKVFRDLASKRLQDLEQSTAGTGKNLINIGIAISIAILAGLWFLFSQNRSPKKTEE